MPRPTIDHLLDIDVQVWRPTIVSDDIAIEEREYVALPTTYRAFLNRPVQAEANLDAGLSPVGNVRWYGRYDIDVQPRDVVEVVSGPETGKRFEVNGPPVRPKNHHTQVDCIEWNGVLPIDLS